MTRNAQKKMRKLALMMCSAILLACVSIGATLAYLTSQDAVTNSFTVGNVKITLDEADVNKDGTPIPNASRVKSNEYHLIPGRSYTKDPTIHVDQKSENCWLFVKLENGVSAIEKSGSTTIAAQMAKNGWTAVSGATNVYAYNAIAKGGDNVPVFGSFVIDGNAAVSGYERAKITVTAYAVQAEGFATPAAAWAVLSE